MSGQFSHVLGLHHAAELSPQFVGAAFDERVMGNAHDGAVGAIQGHRNLSSLLKQLVEFFLQHRRRFVHESASVRTSRDPQSPKPAALYHRIARFSY